MASPPKVRLFVACDGAIKDNATGKVTLVGVFDQFAGAQFPASYGPFAIYFRMNGLNGRYDFRLVIVAPDLHTVVAEADFPVGLVVTDPLTSVDGVVDIPAFEFAGPSRYAIRLAYNGLIADELTLSVETSS